jgi:hypothetical protein
MNLHFAPNRRPWQAVIDRAPGRWHANGFFEIEIAIQIEIEVPCLFDFDGDFDFV